MESFRVGAIKVPASMLNTDIPLGVAFFVQDWVAHTRSRPLDALAFVLWRLR